MIGRALVKGWLDSFEDRKRKAVHDLFDIVENSTDEELKVDAFAALVRAGDADRKREELDLKRQVFDEAKRLRLLELLKHIDPGTLAAIASRHAGIAGDGRENEGQGTESEVEGG
jgi:Zn-finger domain-containing protein